MKEIKEKNRWDELLAIICTLVVLPIVSLTVLFGLIGALFFFDSLNCGKEDVVSFSGSNYGVVTESNNGIDDEDDDNDFDGDIDPKVLFFLVPGSPLSPLNRVDP